jgi:malic enzyme
LADAEATSARITAEEALALHASGRPGKLETRITKPLTTARDLALAYSPGVAEPCLRIAADPSRAYDYTTKSNMVAVISNGTAVLGLGNLGALASKPVMEGKVALFKRFADVDGIDLEISTEDVDEFVNCVRFLGASFGGINLEDIRAPECFIIEQRLRELMDIPVFHDDQHGTAIVAAAGLINACHLTGRDLGDTKIVVNGAGAAAIACVELIKAMGAHGDNIILCDTKGVVHRGRHDLNQWKSAHASNTSARTLTDAIEGADVFFGLSVKGALTQDMVARMGAQPIIFAMANPDPEITPEEARAVSPDAIIATGRSDYPNQVNNVLGFPYIFRGALDVRASTINEPMKIAAAEALAALAREDRVHATLRLLGMALPDGITICNARLSDHNERYTSLLYGRLQRRGLLARDVQRLVNQDRNVFAAAMLAAGDADALVTGLTRARSVCLDAINLAIDPLPGRTAFGITMMLGQRETIFIADTLMHERPSPVLLADIAEGAAAYAEKLGHQPRVALLSHSTFGQPLHTTVHGIREAVAILAARGVAFEFDGDMSPDVALEPTIRALYPFCRLTGNANVLIMPGLHSAHITSRLAPRLGGGTSIGPLLLGMEKAVQLVAMDATVSQIVDLAALAAHQAV